jgi:tetratricopeptide (TPR) repeat protein
LVWFLLNEGLGNLGENVALSKATWEGRARVLGPDDPKTLESLDTYCGGLVRQFRYAEASELRQQCFEARKRVLTERHPDTLQTMSNLCWDLNQQGQYAKAEPLLENCLRLTTEVRGPRHAENLAVLNNLGLSQWFLGKFAQAEKTTMEGLTISRSVNGPKGWQTLYLQNLRVRILFGRGALAEAEALGKETLAGRREILTAGQPQIGQTLVVLGLVLLAEGKATEAEASFREAQEIFRGKTIESDWIVQAELGRALASALLGQSKEADAQLVALWPRFVSEPRVPSWQKRQTVEAIVKVHEQAGNAAEAAAWRARLPAEASRNGASLQ